MDLLLEPPASSRRVVEIGTAEEPAEPKPAEVLASRSNFSQTPGTAPCRTMRVL
jgi:hypothetical protein